MGYQQNFIGFTREEALEKAEAFVETLDYMQQPSIINTYPEDNYWVVTVNYYGFD